VPRFKFSSRPSWERAAILVGAAIILVAAFWAMAQLVWPAPPNTFIITGEKYGLGDLRRKFRSRLRSENAWQESLLPFLGGLLAM
jgi:hypothetical protein